MSKPSPEPRLSLNPTSADLQEFELERQLEELRRVNIELERKLIRAKAKTEELVAATIAGASHAMLALGPIPPVPPPPKPTGSKRGKEVALWHLTDFQGAKVTPSYDSQVMIRRVIQFCDKAAKITALHQTQRDIDKCVIAFGGDLCEGLFQFPHQVFEVDQTIFGQFITVGRLCADVVRRALAIYHEVEVVSEWGNHGRIGSKRAVVPPADNFDRMIYALAREILVSEPRVKWADCPEDIQHIEIGNYRALLIHGDEIGRNGFASKNSIVQGVNRWKAGAHRWDFRDVYVGHYHTHGEDALANGEGAVYWTGSTESDNRYAADRLAASALPSQRLHFIDPVAGRVTAQYKIWLD